VLIIKAFFRYKVFAQKKFMFVKLKNLPAKR